ncbi:hypothetical protein ACUTFT_22295 [Citrobacter freundii]|nr:hypothetical protein [Klebsiella pneumoniae]MCD6749555.1 hypothetical protein [Escherichia coli]HBW8875609.1 hypothetical protein [Klebsiella quasipneumoniae subsp. similipneumoniae]HCR3999110.1 hypothetical protein [Citrobacter freundii]HDL8516996.1 hypothetical protein [Yersinia enterocolitica]MDX7369206.1 hypothetical protein [Klebsiella pneumoniae]
MSERWLKFKDIVGILLLASGILTVTMSEYTMVGAIASFIAVLLLLYEM